jgi:hypothetical protein
MQVVVRNGMMQVMANADTQKFETLRNLAAQRSKERER